MTSPGLSQSDDTSRLQENRIKAVLGWWDRQIQISCCVDTICWASRINGVLGSLLLNASLQMINRCHSRLREILHHVCVFVSMHVLTYACVSISMYTETLAALTMVRTECVHTCLLTTTIQLFTLICICWDSMQQLRHGLPSPKEMY